MKHIFATQPRKSPVLGYQMWYIHTAGEEDGAYSSIIAPWIPWTEAPGRHQSIGSKSYTWLSNWYNIHIVEYYSAVKRSADSCHIASMDSPQEHYAN